jgi:uncharacterized protein YqeY
MIKAAFFVAAKEKPRAPEGPGSGDALTDDEVIALLKRELKKRKESAAAFTAGNRQDLADTENAEAAVIETYLPAQMSRDAVKAVVQQVIAEKGTANFGAVMGAAMQALKGEADGNVVREVVNECMKA